MQPTMGYNYGKSMGNNTSVYQVVAIIILFVLHNVGHLRKKYSQ